MRKKNRKKKSESFFFNLKSKTNTHWLYGSNDVTQIDKSCLGVFCKPENFFSWNNFQPFDDDTNQFHIFFFLVSDVFFSNRFIDHSSKNLIWNRFLFLPQYFFPFSVVVVVSVMMTINKEENIKYLNDDLCPVYTSHDCNVILFFTISSSNGNTDERMIRLVKKKMFMIWSMLLFKKKPSKQN